ncbi:MAG: class I tRNA ligase family protein, partial [Dermatophilaceae bacterium]
GRDASLNAAFVEMGRRLHFHPSFFRARYENWVQGLNGDWLISRQRFIGVPIPVWYPLDEAGQPDYDRPLVPGEDRLPIDPRVETPPGYGESQRGVPGGFEADPDVMDTWATSSVSPQIAAGWRGDPQLFAAVFPMDLRPQAHDIIRTWLFSTIVRAYYEHGSLPWTNAAISGWILDPDRKKMSKSKGNVVTPEDIVKDHSTDAVRYWAASGRLGTDAAYDPSQIKVGRRLAIKILNASKFALSFGEVDTAGGPLALVVTEPLDRSMLASLAEVVRAATAGYEGWDYTRSLELTETFFWTFCDDYLELVKDRAYGGQGEPAATSARVALRLALDVLLRLLAPIVPYVTEEVWSWWREGSVHRQPWPTTDDALSDGLTGDRHLLVAVGGALAAVRRVKSDAKVGMRAGIASMTLAGPAPELDAVQEVEGDLRAAGRIAGLEYAVAETLAVLDPRLEPVGPTS